MKKTILMIVCILAIGAANAQEKESMKFELGCNIGVTTFSNYSAMSLFMDGSEKYISTSEAIHFGYRYKNTLFGLQIQNTLLNTSAIEVNEVASLFNFSPMIRHYINVGGSWETLLGVKYGLSVIDNNFKYLRDDYARTRIGLNCEFETGIHYRITSGNYIGLHASFVVAGSYFDKDLNLPSAMQANDKRMFCGYSLMMQYGLSF